MQLPPGKVSSIGIVRCGICRRPINLYSEKIGADRALGMLCRAFVADRKVSVIQGPQCPCYIADHVRYLWPSASVVKEVGELKLANQLSQHNNRPSSIAEWRRREVRLRDIQSELMSLLDDQKINKTSHNRNQLILKHLLSDSFVAGI